MLTITIETTNAAFADSQLARANQLSHILNQLALRLCDGEPPAIGKPWIILDINGNKVGQCATVDERPTWKAVVGSKEAADALHMPNATVDGEPSADLLTALEKVAAYDEHSMHGQGICPYGCDCPSIARDAITKYLQRGT